MTGVVLLSGGLDSDTAAAVEKRDGDAWDSEAEYAWQPTGPGVYAEFDGHSGTPKGFVFGAGGVGAVMAAATFGQRGILPRMPLTAMYLSWALGMFGTAGFGIVTSVWQAMAVAFVTEGSITYLVVVWVTLVQRLVPDRLLGRVGSVILLVAWGTIPLGALTGGALGSLVGLRETIAIGAVVFAVTWFTSTAMVSARGTSARNSGFEIARNNCGTCKTPNLTNSAASCGNLSGRPSA